MRPATPRPVFDANASASDDNLGALPDWDLSDLYTSEDAPELERDMEWLESACADFAQTYEGKLADLDAAGLLACLNDYEAIDLIGGRIMSFAGLRYYQNTTDAGRAQFLQNCQEKITDMTAVLVFFSLEINRLDEDNLTAMYAEKRGPRPVQNRSLTGCVR